MQRFSFEKVSRKDGLEGKRLYLFFDLDGTLAPIRREPGKVRIPPARIRLLSRLSECENSAVAVVTGRSIKDAKKIVGLKGIVYAGNHGLEIEGRGVRKKIEKALKARQTIRTIIRALGKELAPYKGVIVEDKGLSASVHYRMADEDKVPEIKKKIDAVTADFARDKAVRITAGKKVLEVRPPVNWHKGKVVLELLREERKRSGKTVVPFYFGDDVTDEDAFDVLRKTGYGVRVTRDPGERTKARYFLGGIRELDKEMRHILSRMEARGKGGKNVR